MARRRTAWWPRPEVSRLRPEPDCRDLPLRAPCRLGDAAEVALEDYARALARARLAEALRTGADEQQVTGVHVCGAGAAATPALLDDLHAFARDLEQRSADGSGGLGWS
jgi:hypothetical protein